VALVTIEVALLISIVSVSAAVYFGLQNHKHRQRVDSKEEASQMTTVIVKLENINAGITEIKADVKGTKEEIKDIREKLIITEQSVKSAWKRIETLEGMQTKGE